MKITCCRIGSKYKSNKEAKGQFTKGFKDLEEFVRFFVGARQSIWYPNIRKELSKRQLIVLSLKLYSFSD